MNSENQPSPKELLYFSPEPDREGHASYTHVHEIIDNLRALGWQVDYYSPSYRRNSLPGPISRLTGISRSLFRAIVRPRPKQIYMRWHFAAFPLSLWAKIWRIPTVVEVNGPVTDLFIAWPITRRFRRLFTWLMQVQLQWAAGIIPVTVGLASLCRNVTSSEKLIEVIPNGANTEHFHPVAPEEPHNLVHLPSSFCIFFGTMAPWQGIDDLLAAVETSTWPADCPLLIAGDGERRSAAEKTARQHPNKLKYLGRLPYEELPKLVARSKVSFVCTQNLDGRASSGMAPLKLFESLACGVPVIATRMPFQEEIVREASAGILVDENSPDQIVRALNQILKDPGTGIEMGKNGRAFVETHHSWRVRAQSTSDFLLKCYSGGRQ